MNYTRNALYGYMDTLLHYYNSKQDSPRASLEVQEILMDYYMRNKVTNWSSKSLIGRENLVFLLIEIKSLMNVFQAFFLLFHKCSKGSIEV